MLHGVEAAQGYIEWFYEVSHPRMILYNLEVPVPRPPEREVIVEIAAQEDIRHWFLELGGRLGSIKDHVFAVMTSGEVQQGSEAWNHLEEILKEVHDGKVYRRWLNVEGGRGGRGARDVDISG